MSTNQSAVNSNVAISSFLGKRNFAIKLDNPSCPEHRYGAYQEARPHIFQKDILFISRIEEGGYGTVYLYYYNENTNAISYIKISGSFQVRLATTEESKSLMETYDAWAQKNLVESLRHSMYIGCDPEIFAVDQDQALIPAWNFLGSKQSPSFTSRESSGGGSPCYWDGFGAEFTTRPDSCLGYQVDYIYCGIKGIYSLLKDKFPTAELTIRSVMDIEPEVMTQASEEQVEFGCNPSYNAYGITIDLPPGREVPFRSAGGHIHFGIGPISHEEAIPMVKALDAITGVCCVSLFDGFDDVRRRRYYGAAGEYRLPKHGLEYRSLSNAWMIHPIVTNLVFDLSRKALMLGKVGLFTKMWKGTEQEVIDCMTSSDATKARELMLRNKELIISLLVAAYSQMKGDPKAPEVLFDLLYKGVASRVAEPRNLVKNWSLTGGWTMHGASRDRNINNHYRLMMENPNAKF